MLFEREACPVPRLPCLIAHGAGELTPTPTLSRLRILYLQYMAQELTFCQGHRVVKGFPSHHKRSNSRFQFEHNRQVQRARHHRMRQLQEVQQEHQCSMTSVYCASFPQHCGTSEANALHCFSPPTDAKERLATSSTKSKKVVRRE
ncbi:hypothetical protein E4T44_01473 [Aureobasidium sp. EXF-8845]|nr:hypothetical protein E4T44_01473 [Aureobasidium sp. EXF-8845]